MRDDESKPDGAEAGSGVAAKDGFCPIVGIGASAGGIAALQEFFPSVPADSGLAYVVVQHLDAKHESVLASIIERSTTLPAEVVKDDVAVEANRIYVIPPGTFLTVKDCHLHLRPSSDEPKRMSIDEFLVSLAEDQGDNAAAVILSGTGSDGTIGLRTIKERGGLTLAQEGAEYDGMMRSAVSTGLVDLVVPVEEMAAKIADYFRHRARVGARKDGGRAPSGVAEQLSHITAVLRTRTGHDFSGYKNSTIIRRILRRMHVLQIDDPAKYYERLRSDGSEVDLLLQYLLIGVTSFFRDPEAFEMLEKSVIPKLFEGKSPDETVRVWVPGCATGEEAYSIAMLLLEHSSQGQTGPKLQVFATDIDERALQFARTGRYAASIAQDIPKKRLRRFFQREDGTYRISAELRETCLFSAHNLLRDPPFSRLDLLACRNLLIYMGPSLQERVIPLFHYALRADGYLFLGSSENVTRHARLFETVDKVNRIFRKRTGSGSRLPEFPLTVTEQPRSPLPHRARVTANSLQDDAERILLERYAPAYVIIDGNGEMLHTSGRTGKYLELAARAPDHNVYAMARRGLRMDLRAAIHKAASTNQVTIQNNITVGTNGGRQTISLVVQPLPRNDGSDPLYMLVFRDIGDIRPDESQTPPHSVDDVESATVQQLEVELRATKDRLQVTTEELESSNEELKSSNEELSSINEELQSSNEELETSKEELQSINEELQTVNSELNARVEELSRTNNDIANLLESTQIATVFLDRDLAIKSFTPAARDLFRLVESDTGRPLVHVRPRFDTEDLQSDMEQVLRRLTPIERKIESNETEARYIMRVLPYRTVDDVIAGLVVTFVDVTAITLAEERIRTLTHSLRDRVESLETLLDLVPVGIFIHEDDGQQQVRANRYAADLTGLAVSDEKLVLMPLGLNLTMNGEAMPLSAQPMATAVRTGQAVPEREARIKRPDGSEIDVMISATPLFDDTGKTRGAIGAIMDISRHKEAERRQDNLLHELQHRVKNILATTSGLSSRMLRSSTSMEEFSAAFMQRLQAMGRTHDLLSRQAWEGAELRDVISAALVPYAAENQHRFRLAGPRVVLTPNAAGTFALVFFELASNAAKYGALVAECGQVDIRWEVSGDDLSLRWQEADGPPVKQPAKRNFGTTFIQQSLEYEFGGKIDLTFEESGVVCTMTAPLARLRSTSTE